MDSEEYKNMEFPPLTNQVADSPGIEVAEQEIAKEKDEDSPLAEVANEEREDTATTPKRYPDQTIEEKMEMDSRSIYIGNIDYAATSDELEQHFSGCGTVNRVVILKDKFSGHPKGFAFLEFADKDSVASSLALDSSVFCGRQIKVMQKRTNTPGISTTNRPPRGGGGRWRRPSQRFFDSGGYQPFGRRA